MANASLPQEQAARAAVSGELEEEGRGASASSRPTPTALERLTRAAYERGQRDALIMVLPMYAEILRRVTAVEVDSADDEYRVLVDGRNYHINLVDERRVRVGGTQGGLELQGRQKVSVPMPGKVIAVLVAEGDQVEKGQGLVIVEAMKMENEVHSPIAGEIKEIKVKPGDTVEGGALLVVVE